MWAAFEPIESKMHFLQLWGKTIQWDFETLEGKNIRQFVQFMKFGTIFTQMGPRIEYLNPNQVKWRFQVFFPCLETKYELHMKTVIIPDCFRCHTHIWASNELLNPSKMPLKI